MLSWKIYISQMEKIGEKEVQKECVNHGKSTSGGPKAEHGVWGQQSCRRWQVTNCSSFKIESPNDLISNTILFPIST